MMRLPIQLFLRHGQLWRRYLGLSTCRLAQVSDSTGAFAPWAAVSLFRRGLALGWGGQGSKLAPLDAPHTKAYRLIYDTRLYELKDTHSLSQRTQVEFKKFGQMGGVNSLGGFIGTSFAIELGFWGERSTTGSFFWAICDRLSCQGAWGRSQGPLWSVVKLYLPWMYLGWAWSTLPRTEAGSLGLSQADGLWTIPSFTSDDQRLGWDEQPTTASSAAFMTREAAYQMGVLGAGLPTYSTPEVTVHLHPMADVSWLGLHGAWLSCCESLAQPLTTNSPFKTKESIQLLSSLKKHRGLHFLCLDPM